MNSDLGFAILLLGRWSLAPELLDFFEADPKEFLRFLDCFGGSLIEVPTREKLQKWAKAAHIWEVCKREGRPGRRRMAQLYEMTEAQVKELVRATEKEVNGHNESTGQRVSARR